MVRFPVWFGDQVASDGVVNEDYLTRVEEIIDWILDLGLYCIFDDKQDSYHGGFLDLTNPEKSRKGPERYWKLWTQLSTKFANKSLKLIFATAKPAGPSDSPDSTIPDLYNEVFSKWAEIVRSTGGKNAQRHLSIAALEGNVRNVKYVRMPKDLQNWSINCVMFEPYEFSVSTTFTCVRKGANQYSSMSGERIIGVWRTTLSSLILSTGT